MLYSKVLLCVLLSVSTVESTKTLKDIPDAEAAATTTSGFHWPAWHFFDRLQWPTPFHNAHHYPLWGNTRHFQRTHPHSTSVAPFSGPTMLAPLDFKESEKEFRLEMDFPGMKKEDIDVSVKGSVLTISGNRQFEEEDDGENYHRVERYYGHTSRSFTLPSDANEKEISAAYVDGVLQLAIPKRLYEDGDCADGKKINIA